MREGFTFHTARALALASLGTWPTCRGLLPASAACAAPPSPAHAVEDDRGNLVQRRVLGFFKDLWGLAWEADFVLNESGMGLEPTRMPGAWSVTLYRQGHEIATGSYDEIVRLAAPEVGSWKDDLPDELVTADLFITAGTFRGTTGSEIPTWGLVRHIANTGDGEEPLVVAGFTPLGTSEDLALAVAGAVNLLSTLSALLAGDPPPYTDELGQCQEIHDNELAACLSTALGCNLLCTSVALGAIVGCLAAGPLAPACIAVVLTAEAACLASCIMRHHACTLRALNDLLRCRAACKKRHLP